MNRSVFGWSYPPGAANDPNAPWNLDEGPCAVCGKSVDDCICPECSTCKAMGDLTCYVPGPSNHRMKLTKEQAVARQEARIAFLKDKFNEELFAQDLLLDEIKYGKLGEKEIDIKDVPDPWA